jgi:hypothetical protein
VDGCDGCLIEAVWPRTGLDMAKRKIPAIQGPWVFQFMAGQFGPFILSHLDLNAVFCSGICRQYTVCEIYLFKHCKFTTQLQTATKNISAKITFFLALHLCIHSKVRLGTQGNKCI